tara:strand:+ start:1576 stop:1944 length:369 start_codon:yes stop_codon:yes gene_type:complete
MDSNINISNPERFCIGGFSFLLGSYLSYQIYKKIDKKENIKIDEEKISPLEQVKECRKKGYIILMNTILEYNKKKPKGDFKDFMKDMWPSDYEIIINNENNNTTCKRDYSEWERIFNKIKYD